MARPDGAVILAMAMRAAQNIGVVKDGWNGFNVLHTAAGRVGALDVCALPGADGGKGTRDILAAAKAGELDVLWLVGADELNTAALGETFVVYQGSHGDNGAHRADVILPGAAYTEKSATYVNTEGRPQIARRAIFPPGEAREDWSIVRALSDILGHRQPWNSLEGLRAEMYRIAPQLAQLDQVVPADAAQLAELMQGGARYSQDAFAASVSDFYLSNPIARASRTMAECSALRQQRHLEAAE